MMKEKRDQQIQNAISVENISKTFSIPHDKANTLKGAFVNIFHKKSYESFNALEDVSFTVEKGEFFGILGRNGSGKSTLLKILAGVYVADKGKMKISGLVSPFLELGIGFNPELSGRDNIYLNATVLGLTEKEIDEKFDSIVSFSELGRFIDQKIKNYSSGMQVRLAFSVAIHANREILLMDEVLAVGDSNFQSKCLEEFSRYKEMGKTVILVTHDIATVQRYCDRAMLLRDGKIEMIGNPEEVGKHYLYQNMLDNNKLIKKENVILPKITNDSIPKIEESFRIGNRDVSIDEISIKNDSSIVTKSFKKEDYASVQIKINNNKNIKEAILGVSIYPEGKKENIFSLETLIDCSKSKIIINFEKLNLNEGNFFLSVGLTDKCGNWINPYDLYEKKILINIYSEKKLALQNSSSCNLPFTFSYEN